MLRYELNVARFTMFDELLAMLRDCARCDYLVPALTAPSLFADDECSAVILSRGYALLLLL